MWRGGISTRKLWVRITHLPRDSAFYRRIDPDSTRWGETEHLLADVIDVLIAVNGGKQRWERPGQKAAEQKRRREARDRYDRRVAARRRATRAKTRGEPA